MGTTIEKGPNTSKSTYDNANESMRYGICEMQGWRCTMEDASMALTNIDGHSSCLFGVMDGHGGSIISKYVAYNFKQILVRMESFKQHRIEQALIETFLKLDEYLKLDEVNEFLYAVNFGNESDESKYDKTINLKSTQMQSFANNDSDYVNRNTCDSKSNQAIVKFRGKYIKVDANRNNDLYSNSDSLHLNGNALYNEESTNCNSNKSNKDDNFTIAKCPFHIAKEMGTTANILLISNNMLYLANCGDSLSVMYKNGQAVKLNQEHKTTLKSEYERIIKCGGHIINNRIEGKLNLTRAIGDLEFKNLPNLKFYEQSVTAQPEITTIKSLEGIEFIIMGCDGLWDCVEPQKLCESISKRLKDKDVKISSIIGDVFDTILSKTNNTPIGTDNMSCVIIEFLNKQQISKSD